MKLALLVLSGVLFSPLVRAELGPCEKDAKTHCAAEKASGKSVLKCLYQHKEQLSDECKEHGGKLIAVLNQAVNDKYKKFDKACGADFDRLCADATPGPEKYENCLKEKKSQFSETCKAELNKKK